MFYLGYVTNNTFILAQFDVIFLLNTVPGILGSQLHVNDSNSGCDTGGEYEQLWINLLRLGLEVCASPELK